MRRYTCICRVLMTVSQHRLLICFCDQGTKDVGKGSTVSVHWARLFVDVPGLNQVPSVPVRLESSTSASYQLIQCCCSQAWSARAEAFMSPFQYGSFVFIHSACNAGNSVHYSQFHRSNGMGSFGLIRSWWSVWFYLTLTHPRTKWLNICRVALCVFYIYHRVH